MEKKPITRPQKPIDWELVDELLEAGCLGTEIAPYFDMHHETFYRRVQEKYGISFTEYSSEKRSIGDSLIRKVQFDKAVKDKDTSMLIFLGKVRLEQREPEARAHVEVVQAFDNTLEIVKPSRKEEEKQESTPKCSDDPS